MTSGERRGETIAAQAGHFIDPANGSVTPPIQPSVTFARDTEYALIDPAFNYGRGNNPIYQGTLLRLNQLAATGQLEVALFDATQAGALEETVGAAKTDLVWIESPCNPTWDVIDIAAAARAAHEAGARLAVDSTVATPVLTRPLELGADIVFHSATKYLNGHSDVLAGVLLTAKADDVWQRVREARWLGGAVLGSFEAWLLIRGLRTRR